MVRNYLVTTVSAWEWRLFWAVATEKSWAGWLPTKGMYVGLVGNLMMQTVEKRLGDGASLTNRMVCFVPLTASVTSSQCSITAESFMRTLKRVYAKLPHWPDSKAMMLTQFKRWFVVWYANRTVNWAICHQRCLWKKISNLYLTTLLNLDIKSKSPPNKIEL